MSIFSPNIFKFNPNTSDSDIMHDMPKTNANIRHFFESILKTWIIPKKIYHDIKNNNYEVTILWFTLILTLIIIVYMSLVGIEDPIETLKSI